MKKLALAASLAAMVVGAIAYAGFRASQRADTDEVVYRDPRRLTVMKLRVIQQQIDSVLAVGALLPKSTDSLLGQLAPADREYWAQDAWKHPIRIDSVAAGYRVRSAGPDGIYGTSDDIVVMGQAK
jgi:hypothetical protein